MRNLKDFLVDLIVEKSLNSYSYEETRPPEKIAKLIQYLIPRDALLSTFLLKAKYIGDDPDVDTMAVTVQNGQVYLLYNKEFVDKLPIPQLLFVIVHEFLHLARLHLDRMKRRGLNANIYNIAADMIINETIKNKIKSIAGVKLEGPEGVLFIDKDFAKKLPEEQWTTEELYKFLCNKYKNQPQQSNQQKGNKSSKNQGKSQGAASKKDLLKPGSVVRIKPTGKLGKITKVNPDGTYEVEEITKKEARKLLGM